MSESKDLLPEVYQSMAYAAAEGQKAEAVDPVRVHPWAATPSPSLMQTVPPVLRPLKHEPNAWDVFLTKDENKNKQLTLTCLLSLALVLSPSLPPSPFPGEHLLLALGQEYQLHFQVWPIFPLRKRPKCLKYECI